MFPCLSFSEKPYELLLNEYNQDWWQTRGKLTVKQELELRSDKRIWENLKHKKGYMCGASPHKLLTSGLVLNFWAIWAPFHLANIIKIKFTSRKEVCIITRNIYGWLNWYWLSIEDYRFEEFLQDTVHMGKYLYDIINIYIWSLPLLLTEVLKPLEFSE